MNFQFKKNYKMLFPGPINHLKQLSFNINNKPQVIKMRNNSDNFDNPLLIQESQRSSATSEERGQRPTRVRAMQSRPSERPGHLRQGQRRGHGHDSTHVGVSLQLGTGRQGHHRSVEQLTDLLQH